MTPAISLDELAELTPLTMAEIETDLSFFRTCPGKFARGVERREYLWLLETAKQFHRLSSALSHIGGDLDGFARSTFEQAREAGWEDTDNA